MGWYAMPKGMAGGDTLVPCGIDRALVRADSVRHFEHTCAQLHATLPVGVSAKLQCKHNGGSGSRGIANRAKYPVQCSAGCWNSYGKAKHEIGFAKDAVKLGIPAENRAAHKANRAEIRAEATAAKRKRAKRDKDAAKRAEKRADAESA